jgi:ABC-type Na+ efflux pump permease subunit
MKNTHIFERRTGVQFLFLFGTIITAFFMLLAQRTERNWIIKLSHWVSVGHGLLLVIRVIKEQFTIHFRRINRPAHVFIEMVIAVYPVSWYKIKIILFSA